MDLLKGSENSNKGVDFGNLTAVEGYHTTVKDHKYEAGGCCGFAAEKKTGVDKEVQHVSYGDAMGHTVISQEPTSKGGFPPDYSRAGSFSGGFNATVRPVPGRAHHVENLYSNVADSRV